MYNKTSLLALLLLLFSAGSVWSQGWVGGSNNDIRTLDATGAVNQNLKVGIGVNAPTAQFHTSGPLLRHENLPKDTLDSVLVIDADGYVRLMSLNEWVTINNIGQGGGSGSGDDDWQVAAGSSLPLDINDNIFTNGVVAIGKSQGLVNSASLDAAKPISTDEHYMIGGTRILAATNSLTSTLVGVNAGNLTMSGASNTFVGSNAGLSNGTGRYNVFMGDGAGQNNTSGDFNNFVGRLAGYNHVSGLANNFFGNGAGYSNQTGAFNCFFGSNAGFLNVSGSDNVNIGRTTGNSNTTGNNNVNVGSLAGNKSPSGSENVNIGFAAGLSGEGNQNTLLGTESGYYNKGGENNVFIGYRAGFGQSNITSGSGNVFIGSRAGAAELGSNKLYIDNSATTTPLIYGEFDNNRVAINDNSFGNPQYHFWVNGDAGASGAWNSLSDERVKKNFAPIDNALEKITSLNGYTYDFRVGEIESLELPEGRKLGIKAQEVEKVFPEAISKGGEYMLVNYDALIPVLIEAVKELSVYEDENKALREEVADMDARLAELEQLVESLAVNNRQTEGSNTSNTADREEAPELLQNSPNPFNEETTIQYYVPEGAAGARIEVVGLSGIQLATYDGLSVGWGAINIPASALASGTYVYSLIVNGEKVDSKRMVIQ